MIELRRSGDAASRLPLLVIPGLDGSIGSVAPLVERLASARPVVLADFTHETNRTLEDLAKEIAGSVRRDIPGQFDVLGQSIGTIVAAQIASLHGLIVRRVVLISTFTKLNWTKLRLSNLVVLIGPRWLYRTTTPLLMRLVCGPVGDGAAHPFFAAAGDSDPTQTIKRTAWEIGRDFSTDLLRVEQPTLILMGTKDRFVPNARREIERLRALLAGRRVRIVAIEGAGHVLLPSATVQQAVSAIEEFLA